MNDHYDKIVINIDEHIHGMPGINLFQYVYYHETMTMLIYYNDIVIEKYIGEDAFDIYKLTQNKDEESIKLTNKISIGEIKRIASSICNIDIKTLNSKRRFKKAVWARYLCFWYIKKYLEYSNVDCGAVFLLDHATVTHGLKQINNLYLNGWEEKTKNIFQKRINDIHCELENKKLVN